MSAALTLFLAALLAWSALHKAIGRERLVVAVARLTGAGPALAMPLLALAASLEALAALALLMPALRSGGAIGAGLIWLGYAFALARHRGETLDCGCDLFARERPVDGIALARPAVLAALAGMVSLAGTAAWSFESPFAAAALLALWFASAELHAIPKLARIRP